MTDPGEVEKYPWPNPKDYLDIEEATKRAKEIPEEYVVRDSFGHAMLSSSKVTVAQMLTNIGVQLESIRKKVG